MPAEATIPLQDAETKAELAEYKRDDETWDEFLLRIAPGSEAGGVVVTGTLMVGDKRFGFQTTTNIE